MKRFNFSYFYILITSISIITSHHTHAKPWQKTVIVMEDIAQKFDQNSSCDIQQWANKLQNSCKCCLIKKAYEVLSGEASAIKSIEECINEKKECDTGIIDNLLDQAELPDTDENQETILKELLTFLYNQSIIVKEIEPGGTFFDSNGHFKTNFVGQFLEQAFKAGILKEPDFKSSSCITAEDIMKEKGFQTRQLLKVQTTCGSTKKSYILKEIATGPDEILRLTESSIIADLKPYIFPNIIAGYPTFIMPTAYISYRYNDKNHYLSLMPESSGIKLDKLAQMYLEKKISKDMVKKIYYETGKAFSLLHKAFMHKYGNLQSDKVLKTTLVHGDAHQANIFYDITNNQVIFIDNERIKNYSPKTPSWEIEYFFFTTFALFTPKEVKNNTIFFNDWIYLTTKAFIQGYVSIYERQQKTNALHEIYNELRQDKRYIQYQEGMEKALQELIKEDKTTITEKI